MDSLILKIKKTLIDHKMVDPGDTVLVGVSGGPDSVALLQGLLELKHEFGFELVIAHLNHSARGKESDRDAQFVKELGEALQIETFIEKKNVEAEMAISKTSFQETARNLRKDFFQRVMSQAKANKIAFGHTSDDQVETVLMNLLRGSGLKGMGGMSPVRFPYIRPLFYCSRFEILEFLNNREIPYCKDSSNEKTDYLRNRIRLELIPYLQEKYNPRVLENLFETSGILRADNAYMEMVEECEFDRIGQRFGDDGSLSMDIEYFAMQPLAIKRRLIRKGIQSVKGDLKRVSSFHIQEILHLFEKSQKGKKLDLPDHLEILCLGNRVVFKKKPGADSSILSNNSLVVPDWMTPLNVPGETTIEKAGLTLKSEVIDTIDEKLPVKEANQAYLDFDKTGKNITIRFFQVGDRLKPLGMKGTKKLKSLFIDEKVPREIRSKIPILTTEDNNIIWVYGTRIADPYRVTSKTSKILYVKGLP